MIIPIDSLFTKAGFNTLVDNVTYINDYNFYILGRDSLRHTNSNGSERKQIEEYAEMEEIKEIPNMDKYTIVAVNDKLYVEKI